MGEAFFALDQERKYYLPNMVERLLKEAEQEAEIENHKRAADWLKTFSETREGEATTEEALSVLLEAQVRGYQVTKGVTGIIEVSRKDTGNSYLWSNADIIRFANLIIKR